MQTMILTVTGMHCPKCEAKVESALSALNGVEAVKATYPENKVELAYCGDQSVLAEAKAAIDALGFAVEEQSA